MASGSNSKTRKELFEGLLSFISGDTDDNTIKRLKKMSVEAVAYMWDFEIHEHDKPILI